MNELEQLKQKAISLRDELENTIINANKLIDETIPKDRIKNQIEKASFYWETLPQWKKDMIRK